MLYAVCIGFSGASSRLRPASAHNWPTPRRRRLDAEALRCNSTRRRLHAVGDEATNPSNTIVNVFGEKFVTNKREIDRWVRFSRSHDVSLCLDVDFGRFGFVHGEMWKVQSLGLILSVLCWEFSKLAGGIGKEALGGLDGELLSRAMNEHMALTVNSSARHSVNSNDGGYPSSCLHLNRDGICFSD